MSELYKGLRVPQYADPSDGPLAFRQMVDTGPIPRFATVAARNAAIPAPVKGQVCYRADAQSGGQIEFYTGAKWVMVTWSHTHAGSQITGETMSGDRIVDHSIEVSGANDKLTGIIAVGHLPVATTSAKGVMESDHPHASLPYVSLTEDTLQAMAGPLRVPGGSDAAPGLQIGAGGEGVYSDTGNALEFKAGGVNFRFSGNGLAFLPGADNQLGLGGAAFRWKYLYAVDGSINTSDPARKHIGGRLSNALDLIRGVDPITFRWRDKDDGKHFGFNAAEMQETIPEVVKGKPGNLAIRERDLLAVLWAAVRELDARTA